MKRTSIIILFLLIILFQKFYCQKNELLVPLKDTITGKYGFISKSDSSKFIIKPGYGTAFPFCNDFARVTQNGLYTIINKKGELLFKPRFTNLSTVFNNLLITKQDSLYSIANSYGERLIEFNPKSFNWEKEIYEKLNDTTIKDGSLIKRILAMYDDKNKRFYEMINMSFDNTELAIFILKYFNGMLLDMHGAKELNYLKSKNYKFIGK